MSPHANDYERKKECQKPLAPALRRFATGDLQFDYNKAPNTGNSLGCALRETGAVQATESEGVRSRARLVGCRRVNGFLELFDQRGRRVRSRQAVLVV